jgi:hypothetical protein
MVVTESQLKVKGWDATVQVHGMHGAHGSHGIHDCHGIHCRICGRDGRATASVRGDGGSIPTGGALEVCPCDFGPKQFGWLINQLGEP